MVCLFLNCKLLRNVATIRDYNSFLYNRSAPPHYQSFINEVHLLFDTPGCDENFNIKLFEQNRRDKGKEQHPVATLHFTSSKQPSEILRLSFCSYQTELLLLHGQTLYLCGCFPPNSSNHSYNNKFSGNFLPVSMTRYFCNSREADQWGSNFQ